MTRLRTLRLLGITFVLLLMVAAGMSLWVANTFHWRFDLTATLRHSLSDTSRATLTRVQGPVTIEAFAGAKSELREAIRALVGRYQAEKADMTLVFIDPDQAPDRVRAEGVQFEGEIRIRQGEKREALPPHQLTEETLTNALARLALPRRHLALFVTGHGEASPESEANFGLSLFGAQLKARGYDVVAGPLSSWPTIPDNAAVLVIAAARASWLTGEIATLNAFLERGGNLLWLTEPGGRDRSLDPVAAKLGLVWPSGLAVDPAAESAAGSADAIIVSEYGTHRITEGFTLQTLFPGSGVVMASDAPSASGRAFSVTPVVSTRREAWRETGRLDQAVEFDEKRDQQGPLTLVLALERDTTAGTRGTGKQRVVVTGDADFLSNQFLGNGGNLELGVRVMRWLAEDDAWITVPARPAPDRQIGLSNTALALLAGFFLFVLPIALATTGVVIWARRRRR